MEQYIILKQFDLKGKIFYKDRLVNTDAFTEAHIKRLIANNYISTLQKMDSSYEPPAHYEMVDEFLTPAEVNKLRKPDLIQYALHIGVEDFNTGAKIEEQRGTVNTFIANAGDAGSDDEEDDNEDEATDGTDNQNEIPENLDEDKDSDGDDA